MARKFRKFDRKDGFSEKNLLQYGIDHLRTSKHLFEYSPICYDSAGYLSHIGIELIFKAWHLHIFNFFNGDHCLERLYNKIIDKYSYKQLPKKHLTTLFLLDEFEELRYPSPNKSIEIGSDDFIKIEELSLCLLKKMPKKFIKVYSEISIINKGGRVLMEKPIKN